MKAKWLTGPGRPLTRFGEAPLYQEGLYELGASSYAWMVPNGSWGETNIGLIDCHGKSVLVDTCWDLNFTREMLRFAAPIIRSSPIEIVVNTHADGDHCWSNQLFSDKKIIATEACIAQMHQHKPQTLRALRVGGKALRHLPLMGVDKFGHYMTSMFSPYDFGPVTLTEPNFGFTGSHELCVNGVDIIVTEVGPGHTDGDAMVHVPDQSVVYAGDILFIGVTPVMWAGPFENLVTGIKKLQSLKAKWIVPGHGPLASAKQVQQVLDYWHFVFDELYVRFQQDQEPDVAALEVLHSNAFQESVFATWDSPERLVTNAYTLYRHWGADLSSLPGPLSVMDVLRRQAKVAFELPYACPKCMHGF